MPLYDYRCERGHTFEVFQRMTDDSVTSCEVCDAPVERVFHPVAVHFKGSGFYNTDYGKQRRGGGSDGDGGSDSKPDAKPDSKPKKEGDSGDSKAKPKAASSSSE